MAIQGLEVLQSWLWESANILRGSIDSSDFKNYIFGLLFLKRANDVFEEEVESIMAKEKVSRMIAEDDAFVFIPKKARWQFIISKTENIGIALDQCFAEIEEKNPDLNLEGVLTTTKFGDKDRLSDDVLQRLLRHFNQYSLRNADLYAPDVLGDAYEYLIKQFADDAGKKGGEFYTPRGVVKLIVELIKPAPGHKIYDPTCGSGGMLIESARYVAKQEGGKVGKTVNCSLYGQEKNISTWAIGKLNMVLHNYEDADLRKGDTLNSPAHLEDGELMIFDRVIANPPFSQNKWWTAIEKNLEKKIDKDGKEKEIAPNYNKQVVDEYGRLQYGTPPRGYADLAFLQHMIAVLKDDGRAGVVLPHGTLFRSGAEGKIRKAILETGWVEGIVGLPSALFYNTGIPASIWIINKNKPEALRDKVVIVEAKDEYKEGKNQNELLETHLRKIADSYHAFEEADKFMRLVPMEEIAENDYNLNISRYIDTSEPEPEVDLTKVRKTILELNAKEEAIDAKLETFLKELGI